MVIKATHGIEILVDDEDYPMLSEYIWRIPGAYGRYAMSSDKGRAIYLHRLVMKAGPEFVVDHINGNSFDCRKSNLRICQKHENSANMKVQSHKRYKGVTFMKNFNRFRSQITKKGKKYIMGYFKSEEEAALYYDLKAFELNGEYTRPNFHYSILIYLFLNNHEESIYK